MTGVKTLGGTQPGGKGGTCQGLIPGPEGVRCYDDVRGPFPGCIDEVEAIWELNGDEPAALVYPKP